MKSIDIDKRFAESLRPMIEASQKHAEQVERLCQKIDRSNGQIYEAFYGMASCGLSAISVKGMK